MAEHIGIRMTRQDKTLRMTEHHPTENEFSLSVTGLKSVNVVTNATAGDHNLKDGGGEGFSVFVLPVTEP
jgi:hypothetical protein